MPVLAVRTTVTNREPGQMRSSVPPKSSRAIAGMPRDTPPSRRHLPMKTASRGRRASGGRTLARLITPLRGDIYGATVPVRDGEARKIVLIVSRDALNEFGITSSSPRLISQQRYRGLPTTVEVHPSDENGLAGTSFVLCHDVLTQPQTVLDPRPKGRLELQPLLLVGDALRYALAIE
jgi:mRNA-degrading endonuclease toxin of MazEF toxin-antitoxin module